MNVQPFLIFDWLKSHENSEITFGYEEESGRYYIKLHVGCGGIDYGAHLYIEPCEASGMNQNRILNDITVMHEQALKSHAEERNHDGNH